MKVTVEKMYEGDATKAIKKFFRAYPEYEETWKEAFEWMAETGTDFYSDNKLADGSKNPNWTYALHLDQYDGTHAYIALIERL